MILLAAPLLYIIFLAIIIMIDKCFNYSLAEAYGFDNN